MCIPKNSICILLLNKILFHVGPKLQALSNGEVVQWLAPGKSRDQQLKKPCVKIIDVKL